MGMSYSTPARQIGVNCCVFYGYLLVGFRSIRQYFVWFGFKTLCSGSSQVGLAHKFVGLRSVSDQNITACVGSSRTQTALLVQVRFKTSIPLQPAESLRCLNRTVCVGVQSLCPSRLRPMKQDTATVCTCQVRGVPM